MGLVLVLMTAACEAGEEVPVTEGEAPVQDTVAEAEVAQALRSEMVTGEVSYLVDENGRAVYVLRGEPQDSTTCYEACNVTWKPVLARGGQPATKGETRAALVGTIGRTDGSGTQLTYGGHALYYYGSGRAPMVRQAKDQFGEWFLVRPDGEPLTEFPEGM